MASRADRNYGLRIAEIAEFLGLRVIAGYGFFFLLRSPLVRYESQAMFGKPEDIFYFLNYFLINLRFCFIFCIFKGIDEFLGSDTSFYLNPERGLDKIK